MLINNNLVVKSKCIYYYTLIDILLIYLFLYLYNKELIINNKVVFYKYIYYYHNWCLVYSFINYYGVLVVKLC